MVPCGGRGGAAGAGLEGQPGPGLQRPVLRSLQAKALSRAPQGRSPGSQDFNSVLDSVTDWLTDSSLPSNEVEAP